MSLPALCIQRPVMTTSMTLAIVLVGVVGYCLLPVATVNESAEINSGQRVSTLPGVAQVTIFGQQKYAVRVQVDPDLLAIRGIGLDEVQRALAAASSNTPVGALSGPQKAATLQADTLP